FVSVLCVWWGGQRGKAFPNSAASTPLCASLRPSMASEIFGKAFPPCHSSNASIVITALRLQLQLLLPLAHCEFFWRFLLGRRRGCGGRLPKMCGAMDGGAQAHMDVLVAFFGSQALQTLIA